MTAKGTPKPQKTWTTTELKAAVALWKNGATISAIAKALNRPRGSVDTKIKGDRESFPLRNVDHGSASKTETKVRLTDFMRKAVVAEAKKRGVSASNLIQTILREVLIAKKKP